MYPPQKCFKNAVTFAEMLQNIFANVLVCWTHVEDRWLGLHVKLEGACESAYLRQVNC